jgi:hypothetical protein
LFLIGSSKERRKAFVTVPKNQVYLMHSCEGGEVRFLGEEDLAHDLVSVSLSSH